MLNDYEANLARAVGEFLLTGYTMPEAQKEFELSKQEIRESVMNLKTLEPLMYKKISNKVYRVCCYISKQEGDYVEALEKFKISEDVFWVGMRQVFDMDKRLYINTRNRIYMQGYQKK